MEESAPEIAAATPPTALSVSDTSNTHITTSPNTKDNHPALATTKRKFHRLLENITNSTPRKSTSDSNISAAKRIRLEAVSRLEARSAGQPLQTSHYSPFVEAQLLGARLKAASTAGRNSTAGTAEKKEEKEPNYLPWNHDQFLRRLKTFADVRLWTPKPDGIGEIEWAKRGWVLVGWNTVGCKGGCEQRVVVGLRPNRRDKEGKEIEETEDLGVDVDDALVRRYVEITKTGHEEGCLWRNAGCKDDIYRLPIAKQAIWQSQLRARYESFTIIAGQLPQLRSLALPYKVEEIAPQLPPHLLQGSQDSQPNLTSDLPQTSSAATCNLSALALALFGWTGSADPALATCSTCFRRVGLWLYTTSTDDTPRPGAIDTADEGTPQLDLTGNHRDYCPWVNATSQSMPGSFSGLPAWEILQRLIISHAIRPAVSTDSLRIRASADGVVTEANGGEQHERADQADGASVASTPKKDAKQVEKEDKARFARLKELTKLMGLKRSKTKKT